MGPRVLQGDDAEELAGTDEDIASAETVGAVLGSLGLPAASLLGEVQQATNKPRLRAQVERARALGIFGAPTFFVRGEMFWGNDRLEDALEAARGRASGASRERDGLSRGVVAEPVSVPARITRGGFPADTGPSAGARATQRGREPHHRRQEARHLADDRGDPEAPHPEVHRARQRQVAEQRRQAAEDDRAAGAPQRPPRSRSSRSRWTMFTA